MNWIRIIFILAVMGVCSRAADYVAAPKWQVTVVNARREPMVGCKVYEDWRYYFGSGDTSGSTNVLTDAKGQVVFPERKVSAPAGKVFTSRLKGALNVHSSYGASSSITVAVDGFDIVFISRDPKLPLTNGVFHSTVILKRKASSTAK